MKENAVIFYFRTGVDAFSQKIERCLYFFFLIALSYTPAYCRFDTKSFRYKSFRYKCI